MLKFEGVIKTEMQSGILFGYEDFLTLVDTTGRIQRDDKRGYILDKFLPILERLSIDMDDWLDNTQSFEKNYYLEFRYPRESRSAA